MKRTKTLQQQLDQLAGALMAQEVAFRALLRMTADSRAAKDHIRSELERAISALLPSALSDDTQQGFDSARARILGEK